MLSVRHTALALLLLGSVAILVAGCGQTSLAKQPGKAPSSSTVAVKGHKGFATCGEPGNPACPTPPLDWTPVPSLSPSDILAALEATASFQNPVQVADAPSGSTYSYDPPVLVLPATVGDTEDDSAYSLPHYMIRASVNGVRQVTYDVVYDPATQQLRPISDGAMLPNDPAYGKPFPWIGVSSTAAIAALSASKGEAPAAGTVPELVYFAPGPQIYNTRAPTTWTGGGYDPAYPIWRLHGADSQLYFVGIDGKVYTPKQLPTMPGTTFITQQ